MDKRPSSTTFDNISCGGGQALCGLNFKKLLHVTDWEDK